MDNNYSSKNYLHFDKRISYPKVKKYVEGFETNPKHNFLPLIFNVLTFEIYQNDATKQKKRNNKLVPISDKERPIMYASHLDNYIYKHYGLELNNFYNKLAIEKGFDSCVTAYRDNKKGLNNIHFAAEVINFIKKSGECYILVGDYKGFFDTLNHSYLKERLREVIKKETLPKHQYQIFRSLTNYSYIHKEDINLKLGSDSLLRAKGIDKYFSRASRFREFKKEVSRNFPNSTDGKFNLKTNQLPYGIPQGTAISAIYSNIYMSKIDYEINSLLSDSQMYRRYSDDFIIIIPKTNQHDQKYFDDLISLVKNKISKSKLTLHDKKTNSLHFKNNQLLQTNNKTHTTNKVSLDYLGFTFDGTSVKMREKSIYKYYRQVYNLIAKGKIVSQKKNHNRLTYKRKIYKAYSILGEKTDRKYNLSPRKYGTFITYSIKSQKIFDELSPNTNNMMKHQIKNHRKKIRNKINKL